MAGLILYNALNNNRIGLQERHFKDKIEPLDYYNDRELKERFRFDSEGIRFIMAALPNIRRQTRRNQALSSSQQICIALSYYGSGSFQRVCNIYFLLYFASVHLGYAREQLLKCTCCCTQSWVTAVHPSDT